MHSAHGKSVLLGPRGFLAEHSPADGLGLLFFHAHSATSNLARPNQSHEIAIFDPVSTFAKDSLKYYSFRQESLRICPFSDTDDTLANNRITTLISWRDV
jgi:hypothetical protein